MYEPDIMSRVPVCMCLDVSGSMSGYMDALNRVARNFCETLREKAKATPSMSVEIAQLIFEGG